MLRNNFRNNFSGATHMKRFTEFIEGKCKANFSKLSEKFSDEVSWRFLTCKNFPGILEEISHKIFFVYCKKNCFFQDYLQRKLLRKVCGKYWKKEFLKNFYRRFFKNNTRIILCGKY